MSTHVLSLEKRILSTQLFWGPVCTMILVEYPWLKTDIPDSVCFYAAVLAIQEIRVVITGIIILLQLLERSLKNLAIVITKFRKIDKFPLIQFPMCCHSR